MNNTHAFLIIDAQYDFCHPQGALFVPGAQEDMQRLNKLITRHISAIDYICVTLDTHPVNDISHPAFWKDAQGHFPPPFTQINSADIEHGKWIPRFHVAEAIQYVKALEKQGEFPHFIWPEHCLAGSKGAALEENIQQAVHDWAVTTGKNYEAVIKGTNPLTEHFGIFMAQIPMEGNPETQLNRRLIDTLSQYDHIYLAGEARSHCVATSLKQVLIHAPALAQKMIIVEDCMSDVTGLGYLGAPIYEEARKKGLRFAKASELVLE
ncbi:isochorismatase family protein [Rhodocytophaga rosea]|uniref:Isochorismatase family protein n=1 Tax=Rhodocytophaga rosea TaxID=2704465 RepID=A0A6C0GFL1_9BACT|nr:isochorismatase family protein [Rhodocytophaga rosea]QHT66573.1 isochorismatase family protein [Rhodocytophaga rosea]